MEYPPKNLENSQKHKHIWKKGSKIVLERVCQCFKVKNHLQFLGTCNFFFPFSSFSCLCLIYSTLPGFLCRHFLIYNSFTLLFRSSLSLFSWSFPFPTIYLFPSIHRFLLVFFSFSVMFSFSYLLLIGLFYSLNHPYPSFLPFILPLI
jgi:hypothetical protein